MVKYKVTLAHRAKAYRNGDLECEDIFTECGEYKTRKEAKAWMLKQIAGKSNTFEHWHKGDKISTCGYFTGVKWVHENTGEPCEEQYCWNLEKI